MAELKREPDLVDAQTGVGHANEPHRARRVAQSFGVDAARYDRTRPSYPEALIARVVAASPGPRVVDVGCGTGIVARLLRAAGCQVLGVEVDARMAEFARRGGLEVEVAAFEDWEPAGRAFDAVVSGQSWHWVDPAKGAANAARALCPGGRLTVFWNAFAPPLEIAEAFASVYRHVAPDLPFSPWAAPTLDADASLAARAVDGMRAAGDFGDAEQWRFGWERTYSRDDWLDQVPTHGGHHQLPTAQLNQLLAGLGAAFDVFGGSITMPYVTLAVTAERTG
ncbi:class I SAM-dependent methyltransferase [Frankia sp. Ag45/Mut15]|uniref:Class I SAM-dependent methyltransferase n=1 Tax=Frankia umida TaxID=573489 RepID=A0ABT0K0U0_9ACTN|nr:class I SAM-dependent methyltransferase [Frankia umida]MCK9877356.1 class I SAM-dependent methyltransferase [Frankia umida]